MRLAIRQNKQVLELLLWALLAVVVVSWMRSFRPQPLENDSYQYLNVAENFKHGRGLVTSLVHFDTERSHGYIPAPLTHFPPGYPIAIAIFSTFTDNVEGAARLVSAVSYAGTAALLAWALILMNVPAFLRQIVMFLLVTNAVAVDFGTAAMSESLFMLLSTGAVVTLLSTEKVSPTKVMTAWPAVAYLIVGFSCWVRYAGYFVIAGIVGFGFLTAIWKQSRRRTTIFLFTALIAVAPAVSLMLRNLFIVGTWHSGNGLPVDNSPILIKAARYIRAQLQLIFGWHEPTFGIWEGLLLLAGLGVAAILLSALRNGTVPTTKEWWIRSWRKSGGGALLIVLCVSIYSVLLFYTAVRTPIDLVARMFLPILPLYLLLMGIGMNWLMSLSLAGAQRRWLTAGLSLAAVAYTGSNARELFKPLSLARHEQLAAAYALPAGDGHPLQGWIESHIPAGSAIIALNGQATGYFLRRPTISMVAPDFSPIRWECDEVKKQMKRFGARYVILYKAVVARNDPLLKECEFVRTAVSQQPTCGFIIAVENPIVRILQLGDAGTMAQNSSCIPLRFSNAERERLPSGLDICAS